MISLIDDGKVLATAELSPIQIAAVVSYFNKIKSRLVDITAGKVTIDQFIDQLCSQYGVTRVELESGDRTPPLPKLRGFVFLKMREIGYSYAQCGRVFNKDHVTALYWINKIKSNKLLLQEYNSI